MWSGWITKPEARDSSADAAIDRGIVHPCAIPNWDNTPRAGRAGTVALGATPDLFRRQLADMLRDEMRREPAAGRQLVFVKSWNEWAEGNHLEPDDLHGRGWLQSVRGARLDVGLPPLAAAVPRTARYPSE